MADSENQDRMNLWHLLGWESEYWASRCGGCVLLDCVLETIWTNITPKWVLHVSFSGI